MTGGIGIIAPTPKPDVKSLGNSSCSVAKSSPPQPNPSCGNPINFSIGNKFQEVTDYFTAGRHPLHFTRYYNSRGDTNTHAASLGLGWRSNFDRYLRATLSTNQLVSMVSERADGRELIFQYDGTNWVTDADVIARLEASATGWALTDDEETVETYEFGEGGSISLVTIRTQDGYTQQFEYGPDRQLASVKDSSGRTLTFTYQGSLLHTVTAPDGLVLTYDYTSSGVIPGIQDRLASVTYSTVPETSQSYLYEDERFPFALTGLIDENGNRFGTWKYDEAGRAISSEHAGARDLTTVVYHDDGRRTVTTALSLSEVYHFATIHGVPKIVRIDRLATETTPAATREFGYDVNGFLASASDWKTNLTTFVNSPDGLPLIINQAVGTPEFRSFTNVFHGEFRLPTRMFLPGRTVDLGYDDNGNLLSRTETDTEAGRVRGWTNTFTTLGDLLTSTGPRTDLVATNSFTYDASFNLIGVTNALGHITQLADHNGRGLPLTVIDANGVTNLLTYDLRGRLTSRTIRAADGDATTALTYDGVGQVIRITLPDGSHLDYGYDATQWLASVTNSIGESIQYTRDQAGNIRQQDVVSTTGAVVKTQIQVFDALGDLLRSIGASAQTTTYGYDPNRNPITVVDGLTNQSDRAFDALNRLVSTTDPLKNRITYAYDRQDGLISVTDPRLLVTRYRRNGFGQVVEQTSPDTGQTLYTLDEAGNAVSETDARGVVTIRTFDALDRVIAKTFPESPEENITYSYDSTKEGNFGIGRLTGFSDETGDTQIFYNERGETIRTTLTIQGQAYTTRYDRDLSGRLVRLVYPSGDAVTYGRDSLGRIAFATFLASGSGSPKTLATNVTYLPFGRIAGFTYGNELERTHGYDQDFRLSTIATRSAEKGIQDLRYSIDAASDIRAITDGLFDGNSQTFDYDDNFRLTRGRGGYGVFEYSYDGLGDRQAATIGSVTQVYEYATDSHWLLSVTEAGVRRDFEYSLNGNLIRDDRGPGNRLTLSYGHRNRYRSLSNEAGEIASYRYNAMDERLVKTVGTTTTHFHYNEGHQLIAESGNDGSAFRQYVWLGSMPLAQIEGDGTVYHLHPDHLGTPRRMTDKTGEIVWTSESGPFGDNPSIPITASGFNARGEFQLTVGGQTTAEYVLQTTTNLWNGPWTKVSTNTGSFTVTAEQSVQQRFYRVSAMGILAPPTGSVVCNLRFPGQYYDAESGFSYNLHRDYNPTTGRYIQSDPIGLAGGINVYAYAGSSPIVNHDESGLKISINGTPDQIVDFFTAIVYLSKDSGMRRIIKTLIDSDIQFTIKVNDRKHNDYEWDTKTVNWDPHAANETTDCGKQSPALLLGHELAHADPQESFLYASSILSAVYPILTNKDYSQNKYDTYEEYRVINGPEAIAAATLGEDARKDHRGTYFNVAHPTSRKPIY